MNGYQKQGKEERKMQSIKLAWRNLLGAGLRTWLNVTVLSFSFVVIIWHKGLLDGWDRQARNEMIRWEAGGGQYWHRYYDPYDPFTIQDSHGVIPGDFIPLIGEGKLTPILITQGTLYPSGRMQSVLVKGIDPGQKLLAFPSSVLDSASNVLPALIGTAMASSVKLKKGDLVTLRWRDKNGAFDATEIEIVRIFKTDDPGVDGGQIWIPLPKLQKMLLMPGEATLLVAKDSEVPVLRNEEWPFKNLDFLLKDIEEIIKTKTVGGMMVWSILLLLAMLAVFDTQVLSIFRRQKEIGTYEALGMTRWQVVRLFTAEGAMHSILAALLGAVYGIPLLTMQALKGISFPVKGDDYGVSMPETIYPVYSLALILTTVVIILIVTTLVSFWPSRKIARMNPTDAIKGKVQ